MSRDRDAQASDASQVRQDFRPGHAVHWIQAKKASEHAADGEPGRIVAVGSAGISVRVDGELRSYSIVDPYRIHHLMITEGRSVTVQEEWSLLRLRDHLISIRARRRQRQ